MAFTNPFSTKTPSVSTITAAEVNAAGVSISQSIDGTGGGTYTPTAPVIFGGAQGLRIASGGFLTVLSGGTLSVPSGGILSAASGSTVTLAGTNTVSGATTISAAVTRSGSGATWRHRVTTTVDANTNLDTSFDYYMIPTLTGNRDYTLVTTASDGLVITVTRTGIIPANTARVYKQPGGGADLLAVFPDSVDSWAQFVTVSGVWTVCAWGGGTTV